MIYISYKTFPENLILTIYYQIITKPYQIISIIVNHQQQMTITKTTRSLI